MEGPLNRDEDLLLINDMIYEGSWNLNLCSFDFPAVLRMRSRPFPFLSQTPKWMVYANQTLLRVNSMGGVLTNWPMVYLNYSAALKVSGFGSLTHCQRFNVLCGSVI